MREVLSQVSNHFHYAWHSSTGVYNSWQDYSRQNLSFEYRDGANIYGDLDSMRQKCPISRQSGLTRSHIRILLNNPPFTLPEPQDQRGVVEIIGNFPFMLVEAFIGVFQQNPSVTPKQQSTTFVLVVRKNSKTIKIANLASTKSNTCNG
jgi:hypothetical protein